MRKIEFSKRYLKSLKKLDKNEQAEVNALIKRLANDENLELKYKDHQLLGKFKNFRECHIKSDLLLIYQKRNDILTLYCFNIGSHSNLFKK